MIGESDAGRHDDTLSGRLEAALLADPLRPDDAARALGADIVTIARTLALLEAKGAVRRYPDGRYGGVLRR